MDACGTSAPWLDASQVPVPDDSDAESGHCPAAEEISWVPASVPGRSERPRRRRRPAGAGATREQNARGATQDAAATLKEDPVSGPPASFLDCLLGPKQQLRALAERQAANERIKVAARYWADKFEDHLKLNPELRSAEREELKAAFDSMQMAEMQADPDRQLPKAHFSAVKFLLAQSGRMQLGPPIPKSAGHGNSRRRIPIPALKHWAEQWEEFVTTHPELIGADRETMKEGFDVLLKTHNAGKFGKAHFSAVMNFLRMSGRHDIGAWKGYTGPNGDGGHLKGSQGDDTGTNVTKVLRMVPGVLAEMCDQMAEDFASDMSFLSEKTGTSAIEVYWEEDEINMTGSPTALASAKSELLQILAFYFPGRTVTLPGEVDDGKEDPGTTEVGGTDPTQESEHWSKSIHCKLSDQQRQRTLTKTQEARERERGAVKHWADRWEEYVKQRPELIGADRWTAGNPLRRTFPSS